MDRIMEERHALYIEKFDREKDARVADTESIKVFFTAIKAASDKAIDKAESAQSVYNAGHNDLSRKMEGQYKEMIPRNEYNASHEALRQQVADLRESRSTGAGRSTGLQNAWAYLLGAVGLAATIASFLRH